MTKKPYVKLALFEYAVLFHPAESETEERRTLLLVEPSTVMARDAEHAGMLAARAIPDTYAESLERCEVIVRPF